MPFLHLPVQSGSDRILAAMNRKHTASDYLRSSRGCAPRARHRLLDGRHRRLSRRDRRRFRGDARARRRDRFRPGLSRSNTAPGPARRRPDGGPGPEAVKDERLARLQALLDASRRPSTPLHRPTLPVLFERRPRRRVRSSAARRICNLVHAAGSGRRGWPYFAGEKHPRLPADEPRRCHRSPIIPDLPHPWFQRVNSPARGRGHRPRDAILL
jgi:hypothetical protein